MTDGWASSQGPTWGSGQRVEIFFVFSPTFEFSTNSKHFEYRHMKWQKDFFPLRHYSGAPAAPFFDICAKIHVSLPTYHSICHR